MCTLKVSMCCCCASLRTGSIIIAVLGIVFYGLSAVASFATKNWIGGVLYVLTTLPSVFLFLGAKDSRKGYMISWLVLHGIYLVLNLIGSVAMVVILIIFLADEDAVSKEVRESDWYQDLNMSIGAILGIMLAGVLVILFVQTHCYLVVLSLFRELGENEGPASIVGGGGGFQNGRGVVPYDEEGQVQPRKISVVDVSN